MEADVRPDRLTQHMGVTQQPKRLIACSNFGKCVLIMFLFLVLLYTRKN